MEKTPDRIPMLLVKLLKKVVGRLSITTFVLTLKKWMPCWNILKVFGKCLSLWTRARLP